MNMSISPSFKDPQSVSSLLNNGVLQNIVAQARRILIAKNIFFSCITEELAKHCMVMNVTSEKLIIMTGSAIWATQLRFNETELLHKMRAHTELRTLQKLQIKIRPELKIY